MRAGIAGSAGGLLHREIEIRELTGQHRRAGARRRGAGARARRARGAPRRRDRGPRARPQPRSTRGATRSRRWRASSRPPSASARWATSEADGARARDRDAFDAELRVARPRAARRPRRELRGVPAASSSAARAQLADLDGAVRALEARRDEASARAQRAREALLALSREAGRVGGALGARRADAARAGGRRSSARARGGAPVARARSARSRREVAGLAAGLAGLLESEADQRERVAELQKRFQRAQGRACAAGEDEARAQALRADRAGGAAAPDRAGPRADARRARPHVRAAAHRVRDGPRAVDAGAAARRTSIADAGRARSSSEARERLRDARRRSTCWRSRSTRKKKERYDVPDPAARGPAAAPRPSCSRRSRRSTHREPAVRRDVREGAGALPRHLQDAVRGRRRRAAHGRARIRSSARSRSSPSRAASTCRASA